ncbi:casein kinase-like protein I isoform epsilon CKIe [Gloeophyllum trabeum ATCC 11539]|uniref:Casein kinase-like protein I isoform epsilon CKIe n=1 Tax=Gloeophyllum trabeum (strain ATCC 11539 / FP-39264 / Madison 617) TaxID=670483 RepID=S7R8U5_GLOTA|nr:casein kinase-like protein I isoform epsilon CKIe [Gloeophyllum trabeum ATCC 11539]EPQ50740.1 casein kinase-like protein I isoform epsilon CKIe [Gloeophyllum trabeum ATCC 11539]
MLPSVGFTVPRWRVNGLWEFTDSLGSGSFGEVFAARQLLTGGEVAVKMERAASKYRTAVLPYEAAVYRQLQGCFGIPRLRWSGEEKGANFIVIDMLGPNLEHLKRFCRGTFTLKTVLMLADQMITRVETVHSGGLVCRDLMPDNFAIGRGKWGNLVHLFDFGLAKLYLDPHTGEHIPLKDGKEGMGAPRFVSVNVHLGYEQSRRDDLQALGLIFIYLLKGSLPWQGIYAPIIEAKLKRIGEMKALDNRAMKEALTDCPPEFTTYMEYCYGLEFTQQPDYDYVKRLFRDVMSRHGWEYDSIWDWSEGVETETGNLLPEKYKI